MPSRAFGLRFALVDWFSDRFQRIIVHFHQFVGEVNGLDFCSLSSQLPIAYASRCLESNVVFASVSLFVEMIFGERFSGGAFSSAAVHCEPILPAMTIQFPHISPIGVGSFTVSYGQKHNESPSPLAVVRVTYVLNCDVLPPKTPPAQTGLIGHIGQIHEVGIAKIGNHAKSGNIFGTIGALGLHQNM